MGVERIAICIDLGSSACKEKGWKSLHGIKWRSLQRPMMTQHHVKSMLSSPGIWLPTRHTCLACPSPARFQPCSALVLSRGGPCHARAAQAIHAL